MNRTAVVNVMKKYAFYNHLSPKDQRRINRAKKRGLTYILRQNKADSFRVNLAVQFYYLLLKVFNTITIKQSIRVMNTAGAMIIAVAALSVVLKTGVYQNFTGGITPVMQAKVLQIQGDVSVKDADGVLKSSASGSILSKGNTISAGADSYIDITSGNNIITRFGSDTKAQINSISFKEGTNFFLHNGIILSSGDHPGSEPQNHTVNSENRNSWIFSKIFANDPGAGAGAGSEHQNEHQNHAVNTGSEHPYEANADSDTKTDSGSKPRYTLAGSEPRYTISTANCTVTAQGTSFSVSYKDNKTVVAVNDGSVRVKLINNKAGHTGEEKILTKDTAAEVTDYIVTRSIQNSEHNLLLKFSEQYSKDSSVKTGSSKNISADTKNSAEKIAALIKMKTKTNIDIKEVFNRLDVVTLFSGQVITGAIISNGDIYSIITKDGVVDVPAKDIRSFEVIK